MYGVAENMDLFGKEIRARDAALDRLRETRPDVISTAREIARGIAIRSGDVTSTEVLRVLRDQFPELIEGKDPRFMGPVFADSETWEAIGWKCSGSHGRPVRVWKLRGEPRSP